MNSRPAELVRSTGAPWVCSRSCRVRAGHLSSVSDCMGPGLQAAVASSAASSKGRGLLILHAARRDTRPLGDYRMPGLLGSARPLGSGPFEARPDPFLIMVRSNSANTPIIWNIALPAGVRVSMPCWCR